MRVLVAADSPVVRAGLAALIAQIPSFSLAGSVDPETLAEHVPALQPDVVLIEWRPASHDGLNALLESGPPFVMLVEEEDAAAIAAALRAGLRAVLPRHASTVEIKAAIEAAAEGLVVLHPEIMTAIQFTKPARKASAELDAALTAREIEVLRLLAEGLANKNIAWKMGISEHTVKFHIASVFSKLHVSTRAEAVATGMRQGLILL